MPDDVPGDDTLDFDPINLSGVELAPDLDDDNADDDDVVVLSWWWQHPVNVLALVIATALIGGMIGWLIADSRAHPRGNAVDVGFLQDMWVHHEQAAQMSFIFLDLEDTSPGLQTVAGSILVGQNIEIGRMIQMLRGMGAEPAPDLDSDQAMAWMGMPTTYPAMQGMATEAELKELAGSSGAEADALFVELMVAHHEGGVHMAEYAAEHASIPEVRKLAESIVAGQRGEIVELQGLLPAD